jgi:phosphatidylglycerophosphatase A
MWRERGLGFVDRVALFLATGFGTGYAPFASGTFGSLPGVLIAYALARTGGAWALAGGALVATVVGLWAADRAARIFGEEDPGRVVVDEIAGQMIALCFLPPTLPVLAGAFFFFRLFDVIKPWPARRLEDLPGGSGIMADDLAAGLYANLVVQAALWVLPPAWTGVGGA